MMLWVILFKTIHNALHPFHNTRTDAYITTSTTSTTTVIPKKYTSEKWKLIYNHKSITKMTSNLTLYILSKTNLLSHESKTTYPKHILKWKKWKSSKNTHIRYYYSGQLTSGKLLFSKAHLNGIFPFTWSLCSFFNMARYKHILGHTVAL